MKKPDEQWRFCVYELVYPSGRRFYVGETERPQGRLADHIVGHCRATRIICRKLAERGEKPRMNILQRCPTREAARKAEAEIVAEAIKAGQHICNFVGRPDGNGRTIKEHGAWIRQQRAQRLEKQ